MPKPNLLVADADPRSLRILEVALRKAGFSVGTATDGAEALRRVQRNPFDVLVCDVTLPTQDGLAVCRAIRADPRLAPLPVVLMSSDKSSSVKARAIEAGADEFLVKPILLKELVSRAQRLLEQRDEQRSVKSDAPAALTGSVAELGLLDVFQSLENWKKSAVVHCEHEGRHARVWARDGQVIDADLPPLSGEAAFHRLMTWETGTFRVEFGPVDRELRIDLGTQGLLMESMRRVDELGRITEALPLDTQLSVDFGALSARLADLPDEINGVVRNFDGRRPLREAVELSPLDDLSTFLVVQRLLNENVLRRSDAPPPPPAKKPSLQQWLGSSPPPPAEAPAVPEKKSRKKGAAAAAALAPTPLVSEPPPPQALLFAPSEDSPRVDEPPALFAAPGPEDAAAAALVASMAEAEAAEQQQMREEEERAAAAVAARPSFEDLPVKPLDLIRFPPLRGVRRERLRREAEEARARIAQGQPVRLTHVVELPAWQGAADELAAARRMSPAVGEAARKFAPDTPVARLLHTNGAPASAPAWSDKTDPSFKIPDMTRTDPGTPAFEAPEASAVLAAMSAPASPEVAPDLGLLAPAPEIAPAVASDPPELVAALARAMTPPLGVAPVTPLPAASSAPAAAASAPPEAAVAALPEAAGSASPEAAASAPPEGAVSAPPAAAVSAPPAASAAPGLFAAPAAGPIADVIPLVPAPVAPVATTTPPPPTRSAEEEFEAEIRAALGKRKSRWPWIAGAAAAALLALVWIFRPQPATDKKDSPWLEKPAEQAIQVKPVELPREPPGPEAKPLEAAKAPEPAAKQPEPVKPPEGKPAEPAVSQTSVSAPPAESAGDGYAKALEEGEKLLKRGRYKQAVTEFKRAVKLNPESVPALLALGDAYLEADLPRNALKPLESASKLDPRNGRAQLLLGTAYQSLNKGPDAVKAYQSYLALEPSGEFARDVRSILANLQH